MRAPTRRAFQLPRHAQGVASTQHGAWHALVCLSRHVLKQACPAHEESEWARRPGTARPRTGWGWRTIPIGEQCRHAWGPRTSGRQGVAHGDAYRDLARGMRDVIQATLGIGMLLVDGGRQHSMAER